MKLLNYTTSWLALVLFLILSAWAVIFYFNMLEEIYDSMDDGLENQKFLVLQKASKDDTVLQREEFEDGSYKIQETTFEHVKGYKDTYLDTLLYSQNEEDFEPFRMLKTAFRHNGKFYEMRLITSTIEEDDLISELLYSLIFLYLGLLASILLLNNLLMKKIWKPFYYLLEKLRSFRLDNPKPTEISKSEIKEFQLLNEVVGKLLHSNIHTYNNQKKFIENASHELQTPLAISLNKIEFLINNHPLNEEELHILSGVIDNLERLTRLNKSLLLISKISNNQFSGISEIDIVELVEKAVNAFEDLATHKNVQISYVKKEICLQKMNPDLAEVLLNNLIKNAIIHNYSGGYINIRVFKDSLRVENSGSSTALDEKKIFERFHKGDDSVNSTGLGLSIVKAITVLYGFTIRYEFQQDKHIVTIYF